MASATVYLVVHLFHVQTSSSAGTFHFALVERSRYPQSLGDAQVQYAEFGVDISRTMSRSSAEPSMSSVNRRLACTSTPSLATYGLLTYIERSKSAETRFENNTLVLCCALRFSPDF